MNCLLASQPQLYTVEDVASAEHPALPGKYALICRDAFSGIELWRVPSPDWHSTLIYDKNMPVSFYNATIGIAISLVLSEEGAFMADGKQLRAFRLADGKQLWSVPATFNQHKEPDVFLTGGLVWAAGYNANKGRLERELDLTFMGVNRLSGSRLLPPQRHLLPAQSDRRGPVRHCAGIRRPGGCRVERSAKRSARTAQSGR